MRRLLRRHCVSPRNDKQKPRACRRVRVFGRGGKCEINLKYQIYILKILVFTYMARELSKIFFKILGRYGKKNWQNSLTKELGYETLKEHFGCRREDYDAFYKSFSRKPKKSESFRRIVKFYYLWCKRPGVYDVLRPEFKLILMFSIIESLTVRVYKSFQDWLPTKIKEGVKIDNVEILEELKDEYNHKYGSTKAVYLFFKKYYSRKILEELKDSIKYWDKKEKKFKKLENIKDVAAFLVALRNSFIHKARNIHISTLKEYEEDAEGYTVFSSNLLIYIESIDKSYDIDRSKVHIENLLSGFERGLIKFFRN